MIFLLEHNCGNGIISFTTNVNKPHVHTNEFLKPGSLIVFILSNKRTHHANSPFAR